MTGFLRCEPSQVEARLLHTRRTIDDGIDMPRNETKKQPRSFTEDLN